MTLYKIYAGLSGGFGGADHVDTLECDSHDEADNIVWNYACEEYESRAGMNGLRTIEEIMEEDEVDEDEAEQTYMDERESWISYYAEEVADVE